MSAYGALVSLENTIQNILKSHPSSSVRTILEAASIEVQPLQQILERLDGSSKRKSRKKVNALDGRIKQKLWDFEDFLESLPSDGIKLTRFLSVRDAVDSLIHSLKDMTEEYIYEVDNMPEDNGDEDEAAISSLSTGTSGGKMVGLSDEFDEVKLILYDYRDPSIMSYAIAGMGGLGKTALAMRIYQDPDIQSYFDCRVWITVGRKYDPNRDVSLATRMQGGERCLIVLDDVWETGVLPIFLASLMEVKDGRFIRILITTRGRNVIRDFHEAIEMVDSAAIQVYTDRVLRFLNEEESKNLLCAKVFGEGGICPPELDKAAAKIAKNCEGLPLMILTVAQHLSNNWDPDYWNEVAEERNSVFTDSYEEISKVLFPSYDYLPQHLKMPFLFMGVFPRDYDIPMSKILNLLAADGWWLDPKTLQSPKDLATEYLDALCISYNLVLFKQKSRLWNVRDSTNTLKTCHLHSSWRYLCRREAWKSKFFHVLNKLVDASPYSEEDGQQEEAEIVIKGQRGLCLENNLLFGLKDFCNAVNSHCASSIRSLLFFGPYHQYPTPIDAIGFKHLRELDALQLRFYTFPTQILTLFQLRYLALTCNGQIPTTISKLSKLQTLIIHPHLRIVKCYEPPSFIPIEIYDMSELDHIEILGKSLITASNQGNASLIRLSTLVGLNADIGTILELSKRIPSIKKLGIQMEIAPYANKRISSLGLILSCFNSISTLGYLETLKCSIMNPVHIPLASYPVAAPRPLMLPSKLEKLHLSGMGLPWEYMMDGNIASLPCLEVLKLRCHAFRGPEWEIQEGSFPSLQYLAIEDSDLVEWKPSSGSFPLLDNLSLKHCYKLRELEWSHDIDCVKIELEDCNPLAVACVKQLQLKPGKYIDVFASNTYQA